MKNVYYLFPVIKNYQNAFIFILQDKPSDIYGNLINNNVPISNISFILFLFDYFNEYKLLTSNKLIPYEINSLIKNSFYHFINECDKPYDFSVFIKLIESNLLYFCRLLINSKDTIEDNLDKINFLFDLMNELKSGFKNKYEDYLRLLIEYIQSKPECINSKPKKDLMKENTLNNFYLILILIYANAKFGLFNPELLILFTNFYRKHKKIFIMFINCIKENNNDNSIKDHFFLVKTNKNEFNINYLNKYYRGNIFLRYMNNDIT